jgi:hypothetical protein
MMQLPRSIGNIIVYQRQSYGLGHKQQQPTNCASHKFSTPV